MLINLRWKEVVIGFSPEGIILTRGGLQLKGLQYCLNHIGAITIKNLKARHYHQELQ